MEYRSIGLFGKWNNTTHNVEVILFPPETAANYEGSIRIDRPFSSKEHSLTFAQARELAETILKLLGDR